MAASTLINDRVRLQAEDRGAYPAAALKLERWAVALWRKRHPETVL